ncbi:MAG: hypothetical protein HQ581_14290 [Planctomycetes bacterium]|nr:hypothetical protein [Planctomycetota bacterium]
MIRYNPGQWRFDHLEIGRVRFSDPTEPNRGPIKDAFSATTAMRDLPNLYADRNARRTDFLRRVKGTAAVRRD